MPLIIPDDLAFSPTSGAILTLMVPTIADRDRLATAGAIRVGGQVVVGSTIVAQVRYRCTQLTPSVTWEVVTEPTGEASTTVYAPADSGNWDPVPANVAGALDQLNASPAYRAATDTQYVDSGSGDDTAAGDVGTPLATLKEARDRIPNDGGTYEIQCVGAGPYPNPGAWPALSSVSVFGDRSAPVATKNPATFVPVAGGRTAQVEDASFGAVATTAGTHWIRYYFDFLAIVTGYNHAACLTRPSGTIGLAEGDTGVGSFIEQADVYAWTTTIQIERASVESENGCTFVGCIIDSVDGGGIFCDGYNFSACRTDLTALGNLQIRNGRFNGYITGNSTLTLLGLGATGFGVYMDAGSRIVVEGNAALSYVIDEGSNRIRLTGDATLTAYDLENSSGIEVGASARVLMRNGFLNNPSRFIRPKTLSSGNPTMHGASIQFTDAVTGTCQEGVELINGASLVQNGNLSGVTSSVYGVRLDGVDYAFGVDAFSLDTGGFTKG